MTATRGVPSYGRVQAMQGLSVGCFVAGTLAMFAIINPFALSFTSPWRILWGVLAFVAFAAVGIALSMKAKAARKAFWLDFAARHGWTYTERDASDRPNRFLGFWSFGQGDRRHAADVIQGTYQGTPFEVFTYIYTVTSGSGKDRHSTTYYRKVGACRMPGPGPNLTLAHESFGKKLFDALGGEDIDTESDEFSRQFWVKCDDRRFAYDVLNPAMMTHLLAVGPDGTWQWRGPWLMRMYDGRVGPQDVEALAAQLHGFVANLPRVAHAVPP